MQSSCVVEGMLAESFAEALQCDAQVAALQKIRRGLA